jgi:hypothetical protein
MEQLPVRRLKEMLATLVRATASLENDKATDAHRLLSLLQGMIEGAIADAERGRWEQ